MATSIVPAYIQSIDPEMPLPPVLFQYNPEAFKIDTVANYQQSHSPASNPMPQFTGITPPKVQVKILMDAFAIPPLPPQLTILQLHLLLAPTDASLLMNDPRPPIVIFGWGANIIMSQAIITNISVNYERFLLGMPVRATATVTLTAIPLPAPLPPTNPTSGGQTTRRTRTVVDGDTLASIAFQEFRDPNKWRALAEVNKIDDPMRLKSGTVLFVPDRKEAQALS